MISTYQLFEDYIIKNKHPIDIQTKHNSDIENETKEILNQFLNENWSKLQKYWYAPKKLIIEQDIVSHSHPIITINCRSLRFVNDSFLNIYLYDLLIHENVHHWCGKDLNKFRIVIQHLKTIYPDEGVDFVGKSFPSQSSYWLHIIVIWNTFNIMKNYIKIPNLFNILKRRKRLIYHNLTTYILDNFDKVEKELKELDMVIPKYI